MVILQEGAEFLHADRRTDKTKLIAAFRHFANVPKKEFSFVYALKAHREGNGKTPLIRNMVSRWNIVVSFNSWPF